MTNTGQLPLDFIVKTQVGGGAGASRGDYMQGVGAE